MAEGEEGVKLQGREANQSPPSTDEDKIKWICTADFVIFPHGVHRNIFTFAFPFRAGVFKVRPHGPHATRQYILGLQNPNF
jgi:hypothetical protein